VLKVVKRAFSEYKAGNIPKALEEITNGAHDC
jgi:hypothetical protein